MARFIVVPKPHGRTTTYEVIDQDANRHNRWRLGHLGCEQAANAVAKVLNDNRADYTAALAEFDGAQKRDEEPF